MLKRTWIVSRFPLVRRTLGSSFHEGVLSVLSSWQRYIFPYIPSAPTVCSSALPTSFQKLFNDFRFTPDRVTIPPDLSHSCPPKRGWESEKRFWKWPTSTPFLPPWERRRCVLRTVSYFLKFCIYAVFSFFSSFPSFLFVGNNSLFRWLSWTEFLLGKPYL